METHTCPTCSKQFDNEKSLSQHAHHHKDDYFNPSIERLKNHSKALQEEYEKNPLKCKQCESPINYKKAIEKRSTMKRPNSKSANVFCNRSCAATYNNTHKTHGCSRSKLEFYLEEKLIEAYPMLEFHFNKVDAIFSELDIYIPTLKLAFELNGIYHYEPIYGTDKLNKIQNNDRRKFQACLEQGIELCIIDSSKLSYFKESNAKPYFEIVKTVIEQKIKSIDLKLNDLPKKAKIERSIKNPRTKQCRGCNREFLYKSTPKQTFCSSECKASYRQNNSQIYNKMSSQKKIIVEGLSRGLAINDIAKRIGFDTCAGGYYYTLKKIIEEIKKESA
jgi:hypothetical protein